MITKLQNYLLCNSLLALPMHHWRPDPSLRQLHPAIWKELSSALLWTQPGFSCTLSKHPTTMLPSYTPLILPFKRKSYQMDKYMIKVLSSYLVICLLLLIRQMPVQQLNDNCDFCDMLIKLRTSRFSVGVGYWGRAISFPLSCLHCLDNKSEEKGAMEPWCKSPYY